MPRHTPTGSPGNGYRGALIDNVSVVANVPEPGSVALAGLGLAALGVSCRHPNRAELARQASDFILQQGKKTCPEFV